MQFRWIWLGSISVTVYDQGPHFNIIRRHKVPSSQASNVKGIIDSQNPENSNDLIKVTVY